MPAPFTNDNNDTKENYHDDDDEEIKLNRNSHYRLKPHAKHLYQKERIINSYSQLTRLEKELIKITFREGCLKGFTIKQIPDFIFIKTKLNVSTKFVNNLKRMQINDDRYWYIELARDKFVYIGAYRKAIDEINQYKEALWSLVMNPKTEALAKITAFKELHNLTKTAVLLLKDLPFIMNLSKYYDLSKLDPDGEGIKKLQQTHSTASPNNQSDFYTQMEKSQFDKINTNIVNVVLEKIKNKKTINSANEISLSKETSVNNKIIKTISEKTRNQQFKADKDKKDN
jgi:hypothetical protein